MEALPLHPKLVHLPIALAVLLPLLSSGLLLAWWRGCFPKRSWVLVIAAQTMLVASGLIAMRTGEADEERVERVVPESALEMHEEHAEIFVWGSGAVLVMALVPLLLRDPRAAKIAALGTVVGTAAVFYLGFRVGETGGSLVYRHGAASAYAMQGDAHAPASVIRSQHDTDDDH